jgi:hypothetical protein
MASCAATCIVIKALLCQRDLSWKWVLRMLLKTCHLRPTTLLCLFPAQCESAAMLGVYDGFPRKSDASDVNALWQHMFYRMHGEM